MLFVLFNRLHLKNDLRENKQLKYRDIVVKSLYDARNAQKKEKEANILLEKQKYQIIYDKLEVLDRESKIQKLEVNE